MPPRRRPRSRLFTRPRGAGSASAFQQTVVSSSRLAAVTGTGSCDGIHPSIMTSLCGMNKARAPSTAPTSHLTSQLQPSQSRSQNETRNEVNTNWHWDAHHLSQQNHALALPRPGFVQAGAASLSSWPVVDTCSGTGSHWSEPRSEPRPAASTVSPSPFSVPAPTSGHIFTENPSIINDSTALSVFQAAEEKLF
ncbi:uncharacterized protein IWZ02DRAFT_157307 [Phyllosticta citriasiana]|uniref:uncharacterized protein n=1 Tax=Phyllosticta citriasiana TaxID=595635 RepID=UPI0030FDEDEE